MIKRIDEILEEIQDKAEKYQESKLKKKRVEDVNETIKEMIGRTKNDRRRKHFIESFMALTFNTEKPANVFFKSYEMFFLTACGAISFRNFEKNEIQRLQDMLEKELEKWECRKYFSVIFKKNRYPKADRIMHVTGNEKQGETPIYIIKEEEIAVYNHIKRIMIGLLPLYINKNKVGMYSNVLMDVLSVIGKEKYDR